MLTGPKWLALEVKYLDRAVRFYESFLDLSVRERTDSAARLAAGETDLVLRAPSGVPRGGLHTHYAFSTPPDAYDGWRDRLSERFDLTEQSFGGAKSLYFYDLAGNCVEIGQREVDNDSDGGTAADGTNRGITGVFEIVFEVEDLDRAVAFYEAIGFETVDRSSDRPRVRLTAGAFDVELWEPHLGLADARGGVHLDVGIGTDDPEARGEAVAELACDVQTVSDPGGSIDDAVRVRDPDGHYLTFCRP